MSLALLLTLPFLGSIVAAMLPANARNAESTWAGLVMLAVLAQVAWLFPQVRDGGVVTQTLPWLSDAGLDLVIRVDGYAWMFAMLVSGIGALVVLYARYYMSPSDPVPRFFSFFLAFMGSMLGIVLSGNLIQLAMFWELTSLVSFLLIGYWHHRADARRGARMALAITVAGGLCLFVGVLMLGQVVGSYDLDRVLASGNIVREHDWYRPILVLVALGALTKSAQFPFHFWLPRAMAAPTPVSAFLHSATMVKAGVFLLARLWPVLAGTPEWSWIVGGAGLSTLLLGAFVAIFQQDLKGLLAYSTISHLGIITLLLRATRADPTRPAGLHLWITWMLHWKALRLVYNPLFVFVLFVGSYYGLYFTGIFEEGMRFHWAHQLMNVHFIIAGYLFYGLVIGVDRPPRPLPHIGKLGFVLAAMPFHAFFGVILMMADGEWIAENFYLYFGLPWTNLQASQYLGGGVAWAGGELPLLLVIIALGIQWSRQDAKEARRKDRHLDPGRDEEFDDYNKMLETLANRRQAAGPGRPAPRSEEEPQS